jgi:acetyl esterase
MPTANPAEVLEPTTSRLLEAIAAMGAPPLYELTPAEARDALFAVQRVDVEAPPTTVEAETLEVGPTGSVRIHIVRPEGAVQPLPVVLYFHGGGWVIGDFETHEPLVRELAHQSQAAVAFVDFDRSPEAKYPTANEQAYAATKYLAEHGAEFSLDGGRLAVAGDSAGGNMATVVALMAKERGGPRILFQLLYYPVTDASMSQASYETYAEGFWLLTKTMAWLWEQYLPTGTNRQETTVAPLHASLDELRGLPPALVVVSENDILRDEGEAYARKLMRADVETACIRYNGTIHDFVMINALAKTPQSRAAVAAGAAALRHALHR